MLYILVADRYRAKLFETAAPLQTDSSLRLLLDQVDFFSGASLPRDSDFVDGLCKMLQRAQRERRFTGLLVAATGKMLGEFLARLNPACRALLLSTLEENLLSCSPEEIAAAFAAQSSQCSEGARMC